MLKIFQYNSHEITFDFGNGEIMVNATEMAKPFRKNATHFLRNESTQSYIQALQKRVANSQLVKVIHGERGGTWLHKKLALRFAQWLSPDFAVWVDEKLEELLTTGQTSVQPTLPGVPLTYKDAVKHLLAQLEANDELKAENEVLKPKAEFYDTVTKSADTFTMREVAKILNIEGVGQNKLFELLRNRGVLMFNNEPYQRYVDAGWFKCIETTYLDAYNEIRVSRKTVVFQKGVDGIRKLLIRKFAGA